MVARPRHETGGKSTNILSRGYHAERYDKLSSGRLKTVALTSSEVRAVVGTKGRHCHVEQSTSSVQLLSVETRSVSTSASMTAGDCLPVLSPRPFYQDQDQDQDPVVQDQDQDQDLAVQDQDQDQDLAVQDQDQDQDLAVQDQDQDQDPAVQDQDQDQDPVSEMEKRYFKAYQ